MNTPDKRSHSLDQDKAMKLLLNRYENLPKTGKPNNDEWTVVAGILEESPDMKLVSLGTGSKCIGRKALSPKGDLVHDSHAEVVARRGFLIYLMGQVKKWQDSVFEGIKNGKLVLKKNIRYSLVSTAVPCGDAAIMPRKRKLEENDEGTKRPCLDIHRTGAKCLPLAEKQDRKLPGADYHETGQVRTKPGRGDPTTSVSCSDKLAKWNAVGIQGALLALVMEQIYLTSVVIGGNVPFSSESMERAINERVNQPGKMIFLQSQIEFPSGRDSTRKRPAPCSIAWNSYTDKVEVCVEGKKSGATKKRPGAALDITKLGILKKFMEISSGLPSEFCIRRDLDQMSYRDMKNLSVDYQNEWKLVKERFFHVWTSKPDGLEEFKAEKNLS